MKERLIWVDLEMTGLNVDKDHILEMACLITDGDLNLVAEVRYNSYKLSHSYRLINVYCLLKEKLDKHAYFDV